MQGMNAHLAVRTSEKMVAMGSQPKGGEGVDSDRELMPEDARSISQGLWRMVRLAQPGLFMNDLAGFGSLAQRSMNAPQRPLTARTLTPITQNHVSLIHQRSWAS